MPSTKCAQLCLMFALLVSTFIGEATAVEAFLGEIKLFAGNFAPRGYAFCNGQLLSISTNSALFSLLGTTYGGDGRSTFGLPDLRGRAPVHFGPGQGLARVNLGQKMGRSSVTLTPANLPSHTHNVDVSALQTEESGINVDLSGLTLETTVDVSSLATAAMQLSLGAQVCPVTGSQLTNVDADGTTNPTGAIEVKAGGKRCRRSSSPCEKSFVTRKVKAGTFTTVDLGRDTAVTGGSATCAAQTVDIPSLSVSGEVSATTTASDDFTVDAVVPSASLSGTATTDSTGGGQAFNIIPPSLGISYIIALTGVFPSRN